MCFWKGTFVEYASALSPYIIAIAGFIVIKVNGILSSYKNKNESIIRNTWINIELQARNSVHKTDEKGVVTNPYPKTWEEVENDAIEFAKKEYPNEWKQYNELNSVKG